MNIVIPKISTKALMNAFWAKIKPTWVAKYVTHQAQAQCALGIFNIFNKRDRRSGEMLARGLFGRPLCGAGFGWESRIPLVPIAGGTVPVITSGANSLNFNVLDFFTVLEIGFLWQVAGTATALVMDFDRYPTTGAVGGVTDKLDGTNGILTAPTVASQAVGNILYKDLGDTTPVDLQKGDSVQAIVTTTTTAGSGVPYVLGIARAETNANMGATVAFASA